ncbi:MAG: ABC transporter ATP-binding protein [Bacteroidia bacterium]|nr:ABC transporter ATP-binding protein [Bacteroidia bacterium]
MQKEHRKKFRKIKTYKEYMWENRVSNILLNIHELDVMRGGTLILRDINLNIEHGEIVALIGPNGAGKTTLFGSIMGLYKITKGNVDLFGKSLKGMNPIKISKLISLVPQELATFPFLTVLENLWIAKGSSKQEVLNDEIFNIFPVLKARKDQEAWSLSGGQRQMLAISIGLLRKSKLLILDEPTLGLSPINLERILKTIKDISKNFHLSILISDQTPRVLDVAHRVYVIEGGQIRMQGNAQELKTDERIIKVYLGMDI